MAYVNPYAQQYFNPPQYYTNPMPDMLNQYKAQYQQPPMQQIQPPPPAPAPAATSDILWVQGEAGAKAYLVAPGNTVTLWDSENQTIYIKTADSSGIPSMRVLDWTERGSAAPQPPSEHVCKCNKDFVSKADFEALQAEFDLLEARLDKLSEKASVRARKATKEENEDG